MRLTLTLCHFHECHLVKSAVCGLCHFVRAWTLSSPGSLSLYRLSIDLIFDLVAVAADLVGEAIRVYSGHHKAVVCCALNDSAMDGREAEA
jgi:hypothetical protein